jgi:Na+-driven multidrug efflux pump
MRDFIIRKFLSGSNILEFLKTISPLLISQIAMSIPHVISVAQLGSTGDSDGVTCLGLSGTFFGLFAYVMISSITEVAGSNCSIAFGAKNYRQMASYFYKSLVSIMIVLMLYYISIFGAYDLMTWMFHLNPALALRTVQLIKISWFYCLVRSLNMLMQSYMISQKIVFELYYISIFSIVYVIFVGKYLTIDLDLKEMGFAYSKISQEAVIFVYIIWIMVKKCHTETMVSPSVSLITEEFGTFFRKSGYSLLAIYGEFFAYE